MEDSRMTDGSRTRATAPASRAAGPLLDGLVVLDLTRVLAGPYCTRLLADLGARVVKVEQPGRGDEMRRGPHQLEDDREDQSTYFIRVNAGKESLALDLSKPQARAVVLDLARVADVVVENFAPGVAARLGADYETLAAVKPDLVYCSVSGFGQTGPWRERPAFAHIIHAASGMMHLERGGDPAPRSANLQAADVLAGTHAFGAIVSALLRRARTGAGARLDVSMLECLIAADDATYGSVLNGGDEYGAPRQGMIVHAIAGRFLAMQTAGGADIWPRLAAAMGQPDVAADARFATPRARREHWPEMRAVIASWLDRFASVDDALAALTAARVPCAPVLTPREVIDHPHLEARGFFPAVDHERRGAVRVTATPFHVDGGAPGPGGPAPYRVGEHTRAVLSGLAGYSASRIEELLAHGVAAAP
jgi:crotonobetainyl-CoA:carnitine CoA-transferase CaiB-like acyl-CoA transferase